MSYTNQTQHYGLPQYVGTDVPAYLTDYNGAMATIDQGINAAKTQADAAATAAGQATNDIAALNSTVNTQATQISAAAQAASNAQSTANTADEKADALDVRVTALETSGGGEITYIDYTASGSGLIPLINIPAGHEPLSANVLTSDKDAACALFRQATGNPYVLIFGTATDTATLQFKAIAGTVRVFFVKNA